MKKQYYHFGQCKKKQGRNPIEHRSGMVLIIVLVVVFMLSFAGFSFVNALFTENKAAHLRQDEIQISMTMDSAEEAIKVLVQYPLDQHEKFGGLYHNSLLFRGKMLFSETLDDTNSKYNTGRFTVVSPRMEDGKIVGIRFGLVNESSKLNLAALVHWEKMKPGSGVKALMKIPGMTEPIANSIMDWTDTDSNTRESGAESDYYEGIDPGYSSRNAAPESLEELLLIKNVTRSLIYGIDQNYNYLIEDFERTKQEFNSTLTEGGESSPWLHYLTIYSAEKNVNSNGKKYLNINSPDLKKLYNALKKETNKKLAKFIIAYRLYGPYQGEGDLKDRYSGKLNFQLKSKFQFKTLLDLVGAKVAIPIKDKKNHVLKSPLGIQLNQFKDELLKLSEKLTTDPRKIIKGHININRASRYVLAGIPEISESVVSKILSSRNAEKSVEGVSKNNPLWILLDGIVDLEMMKKLIPYITAGGDVYRAQIVGFYDNTGPTSRGEVIIDATKSPPQRLYWKDLQILGKGFPGDVLGAVTEDLLNED